MDSRAADNVGGHGLSDSGRLALLLPPPLQRQPAQQDGLFQHTSTQSARPPAGIALGFRHALPQPSLCLGIQGGMEPKVHTV